MVKKLGKRASEILETINSLRVAIYIRVSTHWQIDKDSLPSSGATSSITARSFSGRKTMWCLRMRATRPKTSSGLASRR